MKERTCTYILIGVYLVLSCFMVFPHLGSHALFIWDEARQGANAMEMYQNGSWIVTTFNLNPDHWNTKPPFLIWLQTLSLYLFSPSETALRLPSALSLILLGIGFILGFKKLGYIYTGFFAAIICLCSEGLIRFHCFRSADYDAVMICFMMLYLLSYFIYTQTRQQKYYILFFVFLIIDTLTKGVQALIPLPFLLIYTAVTGQLNAELKNKYTYIGITLFVLIIGGYYFVREIMDNGYIQSVINNEITGRYASELEGHGEDRLYYFKLMRKQDFVYFISLVPIAFLINYIQKTGLYKKISCYFFFTALFYFMVITIGKTKCPWYHFPLLPMLAVVIGLSLERAVRYAFSQNSKWLVVATFTAITLFLSIPYYTVCDKNFGVKKNFGDEYFYCGNYIMRDIAKNKLPYNNIYYLNEKDEVNQVSFFYWYWMKQNNKNYCRIYFDDIKPGMLIQVNQQDNYAKIKDNFNIEDIYSLDHSHIIMIKDKKQQEL